MLDPVRHSPWLPVLAAIAAPWPLAQAQPAAQPTMDQLLAALADPAGNGRSAAADRVIERSRDGDAALQVAVLLADPQADSEVRTRLLSAIGRAWDPPGSLFNAVLSCAQSTDPAVQTPAMLSLASFRTPDAARALVGFLADQHPAAARQAAADALTRMSGRDDLGSDHAAWSAWLDQHAGLTPAAWRAALQEGVWRRSLRLTSEQSALLTQLVESHRRLYLSLPSPPSQERPRLIAQLLTGDRAALRDLAFELISREVSAGSPVDGMVTAAAIQLLDHAQPQVRARAASLLLQLSPADAGPRIAAALARETDPAAAAQLLLGAARWTDPAAKPSIMRWLSQSGPARAAAVDATLSLLNGGLLGDPADREVALNAVRSMSDADMPPAGCRVLAQLGNDSDIVRVISLLASPTAAVRTAAAGSVADRPEAWRAIVAAARTDPALFEYAVQATVLRHPDAGGFLELLHASAPNDESRLDGLLRAGASLSVADLLRVASQADVPPQIREAILARLLEHGPTAVANDPRDVATGLLMLAKTRLQLRRPDLAAAAMDAIPSESPHLDSEQVRRTRAISLIWSNHLETAESLNADADTWLDALELAVEERHGPAIAARIAQLFKGALSDAQAERLARLKDAAAAPPKPV